MPGRLEAWGTRRSTKPRSARLEPSGPLDDDARYLAVRSRDARFDGSFFVAVTSTGIYCRPSCPSPPARPDEDSLLPNRGRGAASRVQGLQALCSRTPLRVRRSGTVVPMSSGAPCASSQTASWTATGVPGLARRLGYSERHLNRLLIAEVGAGPLGARPRPACPDCTNPARDDRARAAEIAFAAGFTSVRQFNDTIQEVFAPRAAGAQVPCRGSPRGAGALARRLRGPSPSGSPIGRPFQPCPALRVPRRTGHPRSRGG